MVADGEKEGERPKFFSVVVDKIWSNIEAMLRNVALAGKLEYW